MAKPTYDAKDITVLEGLEPVRLRPGMYIGSTGARGLHHLVYEVVDNSVDEALAGHCDHVAVTIHPDNSVTVADDGRGVSVVNALAEALHVEVKRDGYTWRQEFVRGIPQGDLERGETTEETGTTIT